MTVARHDLSACIGCQTCVNTCPRDVFRYNDTMKKSVIAYPEECQTCGMCYLYCPTGSLCMTQTPHIWPVTGYR